MSTELATRKSDVIELRNMDDLARLAKMFADSGYFSDAKGAAQTGVKILAGRELGFGPFASMTGIHLIQGKPSMGANLMAAAVKGSGRYDFRVREITDEVCSIEFFQQSDSLGISRFTKADAKAAGTQNMNKFARNMLYARAMSNGVKWYCPDVFVGNTVYTPEELGARVDGDGEILDAQTVSITPEPEYEEPVKASGDATEDDEFPPEPPKGTLNEGPVLISPKQFKLLAMKLKKAGFKTTDEGREQGRAFIAHLVNRAELDSAKSLTKSEASKALDILTDDDATNEAVAKWTDELALEEAAA